MPSCCHHSSAPSEDQEIKTLQRSFWNAVLLGVPVIFLAMAPMFLMILGYHDLASVMSSKWASGVQLLFTLPLLFWAGAPIWIKAGRSFRSGLNMFSLIALGTGATFLYSSWSFFFTTQRQGVMPELYFEAAAMMMMLVLLGQVLEARGRHQAGAALRELLELIPNEATLLKKGVEKKIPVSVLKVGDVIRLHPGEKIPVDGKVLEGFSSVNEALLTGEVFPVEKSEGSSVTAGTLNTHGSFLMCVEKTGSATLLSQMIGIVLAAQKSRAPLQNVTDRVAGSVVPCVLMLALVTFSGWYFFAPALGASFALARAISVLMITCPCALGLATPLALAVGLGEAAHRGILVRDVAALQQLASVTMMAFDKTGTLTEGLPQVEAIMNIEENPHSLEPLFKVAAADEGQGASGAQRRSVLKVLERASTGATQPGAAAVDFEKRFLEWLSLLASAERRSEHPLAKAVVRYAEGKNILEKNVSFFTAEPGGGIRAEVDRKRLLAGSEEFLKKNAVNFSPFPIHDERGVIFVALDEEVVGAVFFKDRIKLSAASSVQKLSALRIQAVMLTGDRETVAAAVAHEVGIKYWKASLSPQQKADHILAWKKEGKRVAMAGDGINDGQALSVADASIAMQLGSNIAKETASITLMRPSLDGIVIAVELSRSILKTIRENLFFAFGYNILAIPLAAGIFFKWGVLLNPMVAAAAMSLSSLSVVGNSLRLKKR